MTATMDVLRKRKIREPAPPEAVDAAFGLLLAWVLAVPLGPAAVVLVLLAGAVVLLPWLVIGRPPAEVGAGRSVLEIVVPGLLAWLALGGDVPLPAPEAVRLGLAGGVMAWLAQNWLVPGLFVALAVTYHAASTVHQRGELPLRRLELTVGYLSAIVCLTLAGRVWGAMAVALVFVVQWPFEAMFRSGYVQWHFRWTEPFAMAAMLFGCLAVGWL